MSSLEQSNPEKEYKEMVRRDFLLTAGLSFTIKKQGFLLYLVADFYSLTFTQTKPL
jgi:hypothetical protein